MEIRRSASTVSRARGPRLCRRTWEWRFKVRGHSGGSYTVIREEPPFIWLHLWFSWRQPFDNAAEHVPASIREFTVCVLDPGKTIPPISLKRTHQENFFQNLAKRFLYVSLQGSWERNIEEKRKTPRHSFPQHDRVFVTQESESQIILRLPTIYIYTAKKGKGKLQR